MSTAAQNPAPSPPVIVTDGRTDAPLATRATPRAGAITPAEWATAMELLRDKGPDAALVFLSRGRRTSDGRPARRTTVRDLLNREPYKAEWEAALGEFVSKFSAWMHESALKPEVIERYDRKSGLLIERRVSRRDANWAALMVLRRYSAEWRERKAVSVDGQIQHNHTAADSATTYRISADEVLALEPHEQDALFGLLERIEGMRQETATHERSAVIDTTARQLPDSVPPPPQARGASDAGGTSGT